MFCWLMIWRCAELELRARWLGLSEGLIAETSDCGHLSIRLESKRRAGAKLWANSSCETGCEFVIQRGVTAGLSAWRQLFTNAFGVPRKVIHRRLRGEIPKSLLAAVEQLWNVYKGCEARATLGNRIQWITTPTGLRLRAAHTGQNPVGV